MATISLGEGALQLIYRTPDGLMKERLLGRTDEASVSIASAEPFSFDGDGASFQLACEAKRIDLAFLFDPMMAVHTSNVEPLLVMPRRRVPFERDWLRPSCFPGHIDQ